jgi:hypothetical protein
MAHHEARRIAVNIAKLPELLCKAGNQTGKMQRVIKRENALARECDRRDGALRRPALSSTIPPLIVAPLSTPPDSTISLPPVLMIVPFAMPKTSCSPLTVALVAVPKSCWMPPLSTMVPTAVPAAAQMTEQDD